jgi:hypothetical protein
MKLIVHMTVAEVREEVSAFFFFVCLVLLLTMAKHVYILAVVMFGLFLGTLAVFDAHALQSLNRFSGFAATSTSAVYAVKHWVIFVNLFCNFFPLRTYIQTRRIANLAQMSRSSSTHTNVLNFIRTKPAINQPQICKLFTITTRKIP